MVTGESAAGRCYGAAGNCTGPPACKRVKTQANRRDRREGKREAREGA